MEVKIPNSDILCMCLEINMRLLDNVFVHKPSISSITKYFSVHWKWLQQAYKINDNNEIKTETIEQQLSID